MHCLQFLVLPDIHLIHSSLFILRLRQSGYLVSLVKLCKPTTGKAKKFYCTHTSQQSLIQTKQNNNTEMNKISHVYRSKWKTKSK